MKDFVAIVLFRRPSAANLYS